jgi:hypothetical protein
MIVDINITLDCTDDVCIRSKGSVRKWNQNRHDGQVKERDILSKALNTKTHLIAAMIAKASTKSAYWKTSLSSCCTLLNVMVISCCVLTRMCQ